ncbi:MAG: DUF4445 domain-containing protein [Syntrophomonadaceae bacterium]|nr:DUF4445 domain-containing protein [Syntrophomonadaceae bacterium]
MADYAKMTILTPDGEAQIFWVLPGKTVWEAMEIGGWDTGGACGGQGTCSKCKFRISGQISPISRGERERLIPEEVRNGQRLACMTSILGDFTVHIDFWPDGSDAKAKIFGYRFEGALPVYNKEFFIPGLDKEAPIPIFDRIRQALPEYRLELAPENFNYLAGLDRQGRPALELFGLVMDDRRVIKIVRPREKVLGLALDIGTTSLFAAVVDLEDGRVAAIASHSNMQRIYGDDIIARVNHVREQSDGLATMQRILVNNLNSMITECAAKSGINPEHIYKVVAVGNPVMLHFLAGISTAGFERAPYTGVFSETMSIPLEGTGLQTNPAAMMLMLPQLGGFVGADTTACLLTLEPYRDNTWLLLDIGTNGEIVLNHQGYMWTASAAAGPAFEGGAVTCGMRAGAGAIDRVAWIDGQSETRVIGEGPPRGICGSGIIDLLSVLLTNGFIDKKGTFTPEAEAVFASREGKRGRELILAGEEVGADSLLVFNQEDIRQVQLARSAIRTAIAIMMNEAGIDAGRLEHVFLAGTFGTYVDPASITNIGVIPPVDLERVKNIGNAAGDGAIMALIRPDKVKAAEKLKTQVKYIELALREEFQDLFLKNLDF